MILHMRFQHEARREIIAALTWYEEQREGLGLGFLLALEATLERAHRLPLAHELVAKRTRKALVRRFPYVVLFAVEPEGIVVTAVFDCRRDRDRWTDRVREGDAATASRLIQA